MLASANIPSCIVNNITRLVYCGCNYVIDLSTPDVAFLFLIYRAFRVLVSYDVGILISTML